MTVVKLNKTWNTLGTTECFWRDFLRRDAEPSDFQSIDDEEEAVKAKAAKKIFLTHSHANLLSSVKWCAVQRNPFTRHPPSREGHLMCVLGDRVVCTGGYCDDERVHILNLKSDGEPKRWHAFSPRGQRPQFVYGATLTALDDTRAVQFGGFRAGGYSAECVDVCLLTIDTGDNNSCRWERVSTQGPPPRPRAYTSATLIHNRYLVLIGGMGMHGSFIGEAVLDTHTWTWHSSPVSDPTADPKPSGRHGHTTVLDGIRNRLVTFGGGSGTDLLRSGVDNTEVWELKFGDNWENNFADSFPWEWQRLHRDENDISDPNQVSTLTPSETLCLGRCHVGAKVSRDTVVLACGSGHPTNNGVLGYSLKSDTFLRPDISGPLPVPRFTAAATVTGGWLVIHGGYSTQDGGTLEDTVLLDLAPGLKRSFGTLPIATSSIGHHPIRDEDVDRGRRESAPNRMIGELMEAPTRDRRALASQMLERLQASGHLDGRLATILAMVANGTAVFGDEEDSNDDDDDYVEEDDELSVGL
eukprot:CAMPEP_0119006280 /NCGR_PEP_ID=MMETSP1176-20130426/2208_1 /TAXON_ID=265551 /ORGANISM="Synedropsis recta cf, Strain CCMP1620" /LENGTH=525 /DNA_ID=CAMNT_0006958179 /DNA_START=157 /DNA_END=1734 /DNA_ORIENTATION=+